MQYKIARRAIKPIFLSVLSNPTVICLDSILLKRSRFFLNNNIIKQRPDIKANKTA